MLYLLINHDKKKVSFFLLKNWLYMKTKSFQLLTCFNWSFLYSILQIHKHCSWFELKGVLLTSPQLTWTQFKLVGQKKCTLMSLFFYLLMWTQKCILNICLKKDATFVTFTTDVNKNTWSHSFVTLHFPLLTYTIF